MGCIVHGVAKSQTQLSDFHFTSYTFFFKNIYLFICLLQILVASCRISYLPHGMQDLKLWHVTPLHWEHSVLAIEPAGSQDGLCYFVLG